MAPKEWTTVDDKRFEEALVRFPEDFPNRFENIVDHLQMPLEDVMHYYYALVHDIDLIESVPYGTFTYPDYSGGISSQTEHIEKDRKRGIPWTEDEHRRFLEGLAQYGKGDWKSISRFILTRTPKQVASHAQKYFLRQSVENKAKKRSSIHDITLVDHAADNVTVPQSNFDSMMGQPHFGQQIPPDNHHSPDNFMGLG